ncbi:MAG: hypothetical protein WEA82_09555 [Idiomarina sp.]
MYTYLIINSNNRFAQQFMQTIQSSDKAVWELNLTSDSLAEEGSKGAISVCDPADDWSLNYEIERAFFEFRSFDEVIFFPAELNSDAFEAVSGRVIQEQIFNQVTTVIAIYKILAEKLRLQNYCKVTQFLYSDSYEHVATSPLSLTISGALRGFVNGFRNELQQRNVAIEVKPILLNKEV